MTSVWVQVDDHRWVYRQQKPVKAARSDLPCPMLNSDQIEPTRSMVDGKVYTSKAALRGTYKPSGNSAGERYVEIGNEQFKDPPKPKVDRKGIRESVGRAMAKAGIPT